jgi:hypothetical protein
LIISENELTDIANEIHVIKDAINESSKQRNSILDKSSILPVLRQVSFIAPYLFYWKTHIYNFFSRVLQVQLEIF